MLAKRVDAGAGDFVRLGIDPARGGLDMQDLGHMGFFRSDGSGGSGGARAKERALSPRRIPAACVSSARGRREGPAGGTLKFCSQVDRTVRCSCALLLSIRDMLGFVD